MALIKIESYFLQSAMKMYLHSLTIGNTAYMKYFTQAAKDVKLSLLDRFQGKTVGSKIDYYKALETLVETKQMDEYAYTALIYTAANYQRLIDLVAINDSPPKALYVDGWEYAFVKYFCEDEYKALLEEKTNVH